MAYGALKLLYTNLVTGYSLLTLSSRANGRKTGTSKTGTGTSSISVTGNFQGEFDLNYTIEIDSISAGTDVGQATFKWRTSDTTAGNWEETGVSTSTTPYALSADGLGTNIFVAWNIESGVNFALADSWQMDCSAKYGAQRLLDLNRMTTWRTTGVTNEYAVVNFGSAKNFTAFVLQDHNLTSGATVKLQGHTSDAWGAPDYSYTFSAITDPLYLYLDQTYQYARVHIVDAANPDGYIEAANLFLGTDTELAQVNAWWGSTQSDGYVMQAQRSETGVNRRYAHARQRKLNLTFGNTVLNDDIDTFLDIQDALVSTTTHRVYPLFVHLFSDEDDKLRLMDWQGIEDWDHEYFRYLRNSGVAMQLDEVVKV